ncbi:MAG: class I SAM-dependent methyltransferase [Bacteroidota bacterium]
MRKAFQGVQNIVRFNWHFYLLAGGGILLLFALSRFVSAPLSLYFQLLSGVILTSTLVSLASSFYIYDCSNLYRFTWLNFPDEGAEQRIINVHAGFDETSVLLKKQFPAAEIIALDFYDPVRHTEVSIKRARRAYPPYSNTQKIDTSAISLEDNYAEMTLAFLSAHEIRDARERSQFFRELNRITKPTGAIVVTEHLQDVPNFLAYNIGFFHFHSRATWYETFKAAELRVSQVFKTTPFITTFVLTPHGTSA